MRKIKVLEEFNRRIAEAEEAVHQQCERVKGLSEKLSCSEKESIEAQGMNWDLSTAHADWFKGIQQLERLEWDKEMVTFNDNAQTRYYWKYACTLVFLVVAMRFGLDLAWSHTCIAAVLLTYLVVTLKATYRTAHDALIYAMRAEATRIEARFSLRPREWGKLQITEAHGEYEEAAKQLEFSQAGRIVCREALEKESHEEALTVF
jgi:hypothetical protein